MRSKGLNAFDERFALYMSQFIHHPQGNRWKGGIVVCSNRERIKLPTHPRANKNGYVYISILKAECALGKPLPKDAIVHHIDGNPLNNNNNNLLICTRKYHSLLHLREKALKFSGDANKRICVYCKKWDDVVNMVKHSKFAYNHKECRRVKKV